MKKVKFVSANPEIKDWEMRSVSPGCHPGTYRWHVFHTAEGGQRFLVLACAICETPRIKIPVDSECVQLKKKA